MVLAISIGLEEANSILYAIFEHKDNDPNERLLCLKFNFHQSSAVARNLRKLRDSLLEVQDASTEFYSSSIFIGAEFESYFEILERLQQEKTFDQVAELNAKHGLLND
jgi:hypothetical protein